MKESVLHIKFMFHSSSELLTGIVSAPINTWREAVCLRAETHAVFLVKCPFLLSEYNRNWTVHKCFS